VKPKADPAKATKRRAKKDFMMMMIVENRQKNSEIKQAMLLIL